MSEEAPEEVPEGIGVLQGLRIEKFGSVLWYVLPEKVSVTPGAMRLPIELYALRGDCLQC